MKHLTSVNIAYCPLPECCTISCFVFVTLLCFLISLVYSSRSVPLLTSVCPGSPDWLNTFCTIVWLLASHAASGCRAP